MKPLIGIIFMLSALFTTDLAALLKSDSRPPVIILMGPPGAGKGTHAAPLGLHLSLPHISTGDLFRENIRKETALGKKAKSFIDKGALVPDELVLDMLFDRVAKPDCKNGYILDGFPRTIPQAKALDGRLKLSHRPIVLNFQIEDQAVIDRITGRIACKDCGRPYHKKYDPPAKPLTCDHCGGALKTRDDDKEEIVIKRLEVYRKETQPLIEHYAKQKGVLRHVDSEEEKAQVFNNVLEAIASDCLISTK